MVLLDRIVSHTPEATICTLTIGPSSPFATAAGSVPSWVALEYMAQCAAAHSGACQRNEGKAIALGFLLGSRKVAFAKPAFESGQELLVGVRPTWSDGELGTFGCEVRDRSSNEVLATCELSAYSPRNIQDMLERQTP